MTVGQIIGVLWQRLTDRKERVGPWLGLLLLVSVHRTDANLGHLPTSSTKFYESPSKRRRSQRCKTGKLSEPRYIAEGLASLGHDAAREPKYATQVRTGREWGARSIGNRTSVLKS